MPRYPALKCTVRIRRLKAFCWACELLSDHGMTIAPMEAFLLASCTGEYEEEMLAYLIESVFSWKPEQAHDFIQKTFARLHVMLSFFSEPMMRNSMHNPKEFLYIPDIALAKERFDSPIEMVLVLTHSCNFRCIYCYNDSGHVHEHTLTTDSWCELIREAAHMGVVKCTLTGGEPLLHPGFFQILEEVIAGGMLPYVCTNGSLISDAGIHRLSELRLPFIQVSMDTADNAVHDELTLSKDTLPVVSEAIKQLAEAGIRVHVKAVVLPQTYKGVSALIDSCASLGVAHLVIDRYDLCNAGRGDNRFFLSSEQEAEVQNVVNEKRMALGDSMGISTVFPPRNWASSKDIVMCGAFYRSFAVMPNGDFPICEKTAGIPTLTIGKYPEMSLSEMWASPHIESILKPAREMIHATCQECQHLDICATGCFATKQFFTDDIYAPDPNCWKAMYADNPFLADRSVSG